MDWYKKLYRKKAHLFRGDSLENFEERRARWRSIYVIYFTMFLMSLGFSIVLTGIYDYLQKKLESPGVEFMGFVVAANPLGQMIFSPLVGWWGNKLGSIRLPLLLTLALFAFASGLYSVLEILPAESRKSCILIARFLVGVSSEEETWKSSKPDYLAAWTLICAFSVLVFNFVLIETLGSSLTMNQFAWTGREAMYYMGIMMSVGAVLACIVFLLIGPICKRISEIKVMMWGGFFFMVLGRLAMIPWGTDPPVIAEYGKYGNETKFSNGTEKVGCPSIQEWCRYTPQMTIIQYLIGYSFTTMGYPLGVTLAQTIFSKILGPRPQGLWMGLMTGGGCAARVLGPVFVGVIYNRFGTYHTFGVTGATLVLCMVWMQIVDKRLIPSKEIENATKNLADPEGKIDIELPLIHVKSEHLQNQQKDIENVPLSENNARSLGD
ncbi:major facilitator superfamily domain-containing protein 8 isoform X4 [Belonocnema kinseyi]|uniref:major facilitator superfamily domain-containing protein 8 isoform X4 n=1 Tax=Belonocnema kinseyi TaxID=2817044 RepID=UPI00143D1BF9|nr:major facilitator superfamily domain-containing protein 8 isoform X4 [Belonocnema kinseyi]